MYEFIKIIINKLDWTSIIEFFGYLSTIIVTIIINNKNLKNQKDEFIKQLHNENEHHKENKTIELEKIELIVYQF